MDNFFLPQEPGWLQSMDSKKRKGQATTATNHVISAGVPFEWDPGVPLSVLIGEALLRVETGWGAQAACMEMEMCRHS